MNILSSPLPSSRVAISDSNVINGSGSSSVGSESFSCIAPGSVVKTVGSIPKSKKLLYGVEEKNE